MTELTSQQATKEIDSLIKMIDYFGGWVYGHKLDAVEKHVPIMVSKSIELDEQIEAANSMFWALSDEGGERASFCWWAESACYRGTISTAVWSNILIDTHRRGKSGSLLSVFQLSQRIGMFELAEPQHLMSKSEYLSFLNLPKELKIYRGGKNMTANKLKYGMSWTTDINQAAWFADRFVFNNDIPVVIEAIVKKENIFGYFDYENEVVIRGGKVSKMKVSEIDIKKASAEKVEQNKNNKQSVMSDLKEAA